MNIKTKQTPELVRGDVVILAGLGDALRQFERLEVARVVPERDDPTRLRVQFANAPTADYCQPDQRWRVVSAKT